MWPRRAHKKDGEFVSLRTWPWLAAVTPPGGPPPTRKTWVGGPHRRDDIFCWCCLATSSSISPARHPGDGRGAVSGSGGLSATGGFHARPAPRGRGREDRFSPPGDAIVAGCCGPVDLQGDGADLASVCTPLCAQSLRIRCLWVVWVSVEASLGIQPRAAPGPPVAPPPGAALSHPAPQCAVRAPRSHRAIKKPPPGRIGWPGWGV